VNKDVYILDILDYIYIVFQTHACTTVTVSLILSCRERRYPIYCWSAAYRHRVEFRFRCT